MATIANAHSTHTHSHTRTNQELHLICTLGVFLSPSISFYPAPSIHISCLLPSFPSSMAIAFSLIPSLLTLSLHHRLTSARLTVLTPPSLPIFFCPFPKSVSLTISISVSLLPVLCLHNAGRDQDFSFLTHHSSPHDGLFSFSFSLEPPNTLLSLFIITCSGCRMWFVQEVWSGPLPVSKEPSCHIK